MIKSFKNIKINCGKCWNKNFWHVIWNIISSSYYLQKSIYDIRGELSTNLLLCVILKTCEIWRIIGHGFSWIIRETVVVLWLTLR